MTYSDNLNLFYTLKYKVLVSVWHRVSTQYLSIAVFSEKYRKCEGKRGVRLNFFRAEKLQVYIQYSPKLMHAQEVAQEVLVPQEHTSGEKKLNCALSARSSNARSSKSYPQEAARSYKC